MALKTIKAAAVLGAALALGSCQVIDFLTGSVFPSTATLLKATADLSDKIPSYLNNPMHLRVVESATNTYVIVIGKLPTDATYTAFVYDASLSYKGKVTSLDGDGVMVDASGDIVLGDTRLNPSDLSSLGITGFVLSSNGVAGGTDGFLIPTAPPLQAANIRLDSTSLSYTLYDSLWLSELPQTVSASSGTSFNLDAILDDPAGGSVILVAEQQNGNGSDNGVTCYFATIPKAGLLPPPVISDFFDIATRRDNLSATSIGFVDGSILAFDKKSNSFVRIDPRSGSTKDSFSTSSNLGDNTTYAYLAEGGSFFVFDSKARVLSKYAQWW